MKWFIPLKSLAQRAEILRSWIPLLAHNPKRAELFELRASLLEQEHADDVSAILAKPMVDRAPALAKWAVKAQRDVRRPPSERAAAYEFEALCWEEIGHFDQAQYKRREAAIELGATLDIAGFHLEPNAHR